VAFKTIQASLNLNPGNLLAFIKQKWGITLRVRQCQRLFRQFVLRLRKPRGIIAHLDSRLQSQYKNTPEIAVEKKRSEHMVHG
jgi:hypothetical protein